MGKPGKRKRIKEVKPVGSRVRNGRPSKKPSKPGIRGKYPFSDESSKECANSHNNVRSVFTPFHLKSLSLLLFVEIKQHVQKSDMEKEDEGFSDDSITVNVDDDVPPDKLTARNLHAAAFEATHLDTESSGCVKGESCIHATEVKTETFDSGYGVHDAMLNGYNDLFHEVDSLMNIKHEDHLNDTVFYLPGPGENSPLLEQDNALQLSEAFKHEFPSSLFCSQDVKSDPGVLEPLPFSDADFLGDHSKDYASSPDISSMLDFPGDSCNKTPKPVTATKRRKSAESGLHDAVKCVSSVDYLGLAENLSPGGRHARVKSTKSDSQSDDSGIGEPHSVASSVGTASLSDGAVSPVDVCSLDRSAANSPEAKVVSEADITKSGTNDNGDTNQEILQVVKVEIKSSSGEEDEVEMEEDGFDMASDGTDKSTFEVSDACCSSELLLAGETADIDRFVICSDHTMECVLCSFTTDSYSAFKSHIICSHPCWRITKKLSKNRLLVERSIQNGVRVPSKKIGEKALPGDLDSTLTGGRKLNKKYIYRRQLFERNKRLFKCVLCLRLFVFEGSVVNHVTETHQEREAHRFIHVSNDHGEHFGPMYTCAQKSCFFSTDSEADLSKHHTESHMQVLYRCQVCGFTAETADAVRAHGLKMHKQQLACFIGPIAVAQGAIAQATVVKSE